MTASIFTKAADVAHKTVVTGLMAWAGFHVYQLGSMMLQGSVAVDPSLSNASYVEEVKNHLKKEAEKDEGNFKDMFFDKDDKNHGDFRPEITKPGYKERQRQQQK